MSSTLFIVITYVKSLEYLLVHYTKKSIYIFMYTMCIVYMHVEEQKSAVHPDSI